MNNYDNIKNEIDRCLSCFDPPCVKACPAEVPIPEFIRSLKSGNLTNASKLVRNANPMITTCGAVCPEEVFCQSECTRNKIDEPVKIRELHNFATKHQIEPDTIDVQNKTKVAIIGAGPAGISCAAKLIQAGYDVSIFDQSDRSGGVANATIPEFRLHDKAIGADIKHAKDLGVEFKLNQKVDDPSKLLKKYACVFVATGLSIPKRLGIKGEDSKQVIDALTFLVKARLKKLEKLDGKRIVVIGGGNVSLDAASSAANFGAKEVHLLYRRGPNEIKVWKSELEEAQKHGVMIDYLVSPKEFICDQDTLKAVKCIRMELLKEKDKSGRRKSKPLSGTDFNLPIDIAISAVGLESDYLKGIKINSDLSTSIKGVFVGGDLARGEGTIVEAVRDGKMAANTIITYLKSNKVSK